MSTPAAAARPLEGILARLSASGGACTLTAREVMLGRVMVIDHTSSPGCDPFVSHRFELTETKDALDLVTAVRVREEIVVHRTWSTRSQVVGTVLRRELAEVIEADGPDLVP